MKRRSFIGTSLAASAMPLGANLSLDLQEGGNELYEIRTYHTRFRGNVQQLLRYLNDVLHPAFKELGTTQFRIFREYGQDEPQKIWVLIAYPDANTYVKGQQLMSHDDFVAKAASYNDSGMNEPIFTRMESSLLLAFDGLKQMIEPASDHQLFELRFYEGHNEDAVRRKIKMFNDEELVLFDKVGLPSVFFGEMISGPIRTCLVYMLSFKDMDHLAH